MEENKTILISIFSIKFYKLIIFLILKHIYLEQKT